MAPLPCQIQGLSGFKTFRALKSVRLYRIVILICISLLNRDVGYLFMCLLAVRVFFFMNWSFIYFAHFSIGWHLFYIGF